MKLTMQLGERSYDIILKDGALGRVAKLGNLQRRVLIVSDTGVPAKYVRSVARQCAEAHTFVMEQGEASKSAGVWQAALSRMLELDFGRDDAVVAVGGGVVGDLAGFVAASYMRGISYFQCPTTTLSQVDSSIGGKVAINMGGAKNIVGAFYQPDLVVADPKTLETLPPRHFANGLAEALKMALTGNAALFELMEQEDIAQNLEKILYLSLMYKKEIVQRDETEQGERKLLNFGHTIGHGIEAACGLGGQDALLHGECVALGMLPMIESPTLRRRARAVMKKLGLPTRYNIEPEKVLGYIRHDKKRAGDKYTVVRVKKAGEGYLEELDFDELRLLVAGEKQTGA